MINQKYYFSLSILTAFLVLILTTPTEAQILRRLEQKVIQKVDNKIDKSINQGLDKLDKTISGESSNKKPEKKTIEPSPVETEQKEVIQETNSETEAAVQTQTDVNSEKDLFKQYNKFDFIPGENIIAFDDYLQDDIGQAPLKWNFQGNAEVVSQTEGEQRWIAISGEYNLFYPDFIKLLPENFTLEFDMAVNPDYKGYGLALHFMNRESASYHGKNPFLTSPNLHPNGYLRLNMRPLSSNNSNTGDFEYNFSYEQMQAFARNDNVPAFSRDTNRKVRVSIWRQNQRLRLYINHTKVWDLPRAFAQGLDYNTFMIETKSQVPVYIGPLRLAEGKPDLRNKFLKEGYFSTTGIHFDVNSPNVKAESYGLLKEIASVLQSTPDTKIAIIGHTDTDGADDHNQKLSLARATSVRNILSEEFGVKTDNITMEGKGSSSPLVENDTAEGRARNRRVEFKKMN